MSHPVECEPFRQRHIQEAACNISDVTRQPQIKEGTGRLLFLELLFWKNARDAEFVRDDYQWRVRAAVAALQYTAAQCCS